jgi:hypothetical protein
MKTSWRRTVSEELMKGQEILVADRDIRILTLEGELIRHLTLDSKRIYQPQGD